MVDSVNNNSSNVGLYTALGAGVGAVGGGAYGKFLTKPYLKDNAPSDQFIRTAHDTIAESNAAKAGEDAKTAATNALKGKDIDALKQKLKNDAATYGLAEVKDSEGNVTKSLDDVIKEYVGSETDKAKLAEKMANSAEETAKKAAQEAHVSGQKIGDAIDEIGKLADDAKADDLKAAVKKHAEAFGIKGEGDALDNAANGVINGKKASDLKAALEDKLKSTKDTVADFFSEGKLKAEADIADDSKSAYKAVKDAIGKMTNKAALKWAGIGAAALGVIGLAAGFATKKAPEKAPEEQHISAQA